MNKVQYGDLQKKEITETVQTAYDRIQNDCKGFSPDYIRLAFHLHEFEQFKYYEYFGFDNMQKMAETNFDLDKSTYSRIMSIWRKYAHRNQGSNIITMYLDDKYQDYSYSQLSEMLPLTQEQMLHVNPDMTIKEIRDYKKSLKVAKPDKQLPSFIDNFNNSLVNAIQDYLCKYYYFPGKVNFKTSGKRLCITIQGIKKSYCITLSETNT